MGNSKWVVTEKLSRSKRICKARLVARGFEEEENNLMVDAPTCSNETVKICRAKMNWQIKSIDIKAAYLQGKTLEQIV